MKELIKKNQSNHKLRRVWVAIAIVLVLGGYLLITYQRTREVKAVFAKIEKDMGVVVEKMQTNFPGMYISENKYCDKDQEKYGSGQLRCAIRITARLGVINDQKDVTLERLEQAIKTSGFIEEAELNNSYANATGQYLHTSTNSRCYPSYKVTDKNLPVEQEVKFVFYCIHKVDKPLYEANY